MSVYSFTSADLIKSVKRRSLLPTNQSTFTNEDFLAFADEEMDIGLIPTILRMHEDYYLYTQKLDVLNNVDRYAIPYRAIGNKLRDVSFEDQNGSVYEMTRIGVEELPYYNNYASYGRPYAFYMEGNEIVLVPGGNYLSSGTKLRVSYYIRPNSLVMLDKVGVITSVDRMTGTLQLSNMPTDFNVSQLMDLIQVKSPNKLMKFDITPISINSTSKTIVLATSDIPDSLSAGDHIALATQTAVVQAPSDLHVILAHRVAQRCLEALGDTEGLATVTQKLNDMNEQIMPLIDNRVESAPRKVVNRHATLRGGLLNRRRIRGF